MIKQNTKNTGAARLDKSFMARALALARRGSGLVKPNPMVGALIVLDGRVVGRGWHRHAGGPHAEVEALAMAGKLAKGATLYVTLEPCNHYGKTPPCTKALIEAGISRVVIAMRDPNPHVRGQGIELLRETGIEVEEGVLGVEAKEINIAWSHWVRTGRPYVALRLSLSLDGRLAFSDGSSRWLSSPISRLQTQRMRRYVDAVIISAETAISDNPLLTNRTGMGKQPLRVIVDPELQVPADANVYRPLDFTEDGPNPVAIVVTTSATDYHRRRLLELSGAEVEVLEDRGGYVDLESVLTLLGQRGVQGVVCEAGSGFAAQLLSHRLCHRLIVYRVPTVVGPEGFSFCQGEKWGLAEEHPQLKLLWTKKVGPDALAVYELEGGA